MAMAAADASTSSLLVMAASPLLSWATDASSAAASRTLLPLPPNSLAVSPPTPAPVAGPSHSRMVDPTKCPHCNAVLYTPEVAEVEAGHCAASVDGATWWEDLGAEEVVRQAKETASRPAGAVTQNLIDLVEALAGRLRTSQVHHHDLSASLKIARSNLALAQASADALEEQLKRTHAAYRDHARKGSSSFPASSTAPPSLGASLWKKAPPRQAAAPLQPRRGTLSDASPPCAVRAPASTTSSTASRLPSPATEARLAAAEAALAASRAEKTALEDELESLSQALFEEANRMVAEEKKARDLLAQELTLLKNRLTDIGEAAGEQRAVSRAESRPESPALSPDGAGSGNSGIGASEGVADGGKKWYQFGKRKNAGVSSLDAPGLDAVPVAVPTPTASEALTAAEPSLSTSGSTPREDDKVPVGADAEPLSALTHSPDVRSATPSSVSTGDEPPSANSSSSTSSSVPLKSPVPPCDSQHEANPPALGPTEELLTGGLQGSDGGHEMLLDQLQDAKMRTAPAGTWKKPRTCLPAPLDLSYAAPDPAAYTPGFAASSASTGGEPPSPRSAKAARRTARIVSPAACGRRSSRSPPPGSASPPPSGSPPLISGPTRPPPPPTMPWPLSARAPPHARPRLASDGDGSAPRSAATSGYPGAPGRGPRHLERQHTPPADLDELMASIVSCAEGLQTEERQQQQQQQQQQQRRQRQPLEEVGPGAGRSGTGSNGMGVAGAAA